jgi:HEAT repeat protein
MPHFPPAEGPRAGRPARAPETPAPPEAIPVSPGTSPEAVTGKLSWPRLLAGGGVALAFLAAVTLAGVAGARAARARPKPGLVVAALSAEEPPAEPELLPPPAVEPDAGRAAEAPPRPGHLPLDKPRLGPEDLLARAPQPVPAAPAPQAPPARAARTEADLRAEIARMPEVGLSPLELAPLVQGWAAAFAATFDDIAGHPSFEPVPILNQRPDFSQLPLRHGRASRLTPREADRLQTLSKRLQSYLANRSVETCGGCHTTELALDFKRIGGHEPQTTVDLEPLRRALREDKDGRQPAWRRPEAIPTLQQVLTPEPAPVRGLFVELLGEIEGRKASVALAQRAVFDLSPEVRRQAVEALRKRPRHEYRQVLLDSLRYPWLPAAEHGAEALVALEDREAVPSLVGLLKEPSPNAPVKLPNGKVVVREVVRLRHAFNCLTCHPPAATNREPVPGAVPGINLTRVITRTEPTAQVSTTATTRPRWTPVRTALPGTPPPPPPAPQPPPQPPQPPPQQQQQQQQQGGGGDHVPCPVAGGGSSTSPPGVSVSTGGGGAASAAPAAPPIVLTTLVRGRDQVQLRQTVVLGQKPLPPVVLKQPLFVRGDITFLRQDFSVQLPMASPGAGNPALVRFDFVVRNRPVTPSEAKQLQELFVGRESYPQREAVLSALRGLTGQDAGDSTASWQQIYPGAETQAKVWRLSEELVDAPENRREAVLARFQSAKGAEYDEALAAAVPRLPATWRERARGALAIRLTALTADALRDKLRQIDAETRRAAARAALRKKEASLALDLIALLEDRDPEVAREARLVLEGLTGKKLASPAAWREWGSAEAGGGD